MELVCCIKKSNQRLSPKEENQYIRMCVNQNVGQLGHLLDNLMEISEEMISTIQNKSLVGPDKPQI